MANDERKVTVNLSDDLYRRVKISAVVEDTSLSALIRELLEEWVTNSEAKQKKAKRVSN